MIGALGGLVGVGGGELFIPIIVLLYGLNIKLAGSLSLMDSLPTMLVDLARYSRSDAFACWVKNDCWFAVWLPVR